MSIHKKNLFLRSTVFCMCLAVCFATLAGCGTPEAAAVADQEEMQRYLDENSELKNTNSEEPNIQKEESERVAPAKV